MLKGLVMTALLVGIMMSLPFARADGSEQATLKKIKIYLNAANVADKSRYLSDSYRSYFEKKEGLGKGKDASLRSFQEWDGPLHPDVEILSFSHNQGTWTLRINESNDFAKLIGFPGWKATEIITFDDSGRIAETTYIPEPNQPNYKDWLQPAVAWLQVNAPDRLREVYQNGKLIRTETTAREWVELLTQWRHNASSERH